MQYYILNKDRTFKAVTTNEWADWVSTVSDADRTVARSEFVSEDFVISVITRFTGLDQRGGNKSIAPLPCVFRTFIEGLTSCIVPYRESIYSSWDAARIGHKFVVEKVIRVEKLEIKNKTTIKMTTTVNEEKKRKKHYSLEEPLRAIDIGRRS